MRTLLQDNDKHHNRYRALVALVASGMLVAGCSSGSDTSSGTESASDTPSSESASSGPFDTAAMDAVVEDKATEFRQVGMVVLIKTPNGDYINTWGTLGLDSTEVPTLDTKVRVGSNTKTWTGTAILQLVEEGKLSVDDPVAKYRPEVPNGENITIGQLLDMRSGLYNYTETLELNTALDLEPEKVWTQEQLLAMAFANPPYFAPGEGWHYSNTNTVLLGLIAEQLDGKPLAQIFQDRFFTELGMTGSSFPADTDTSIPATYSEGYTFQGNVETLGEGKESLPPERLAAIESGTVQPRNTTNANPSWTWSAGQGISTANDLAIWAKALGSGTLLDEATQQLRIDSVTPTDPTNPASTDYGYGLAKMGPMYGHTGELPGYNSFMGYDPENDVTIVAWGNSAPTAEGDSPAVELVKELVPFAYAGAADETADETAGDIDQLDDATGN